MKWLKLVFFLCNLFAVTAFTLAAFDIFRDFVQAHYFYFMVPLWIGGIGSFGLPWYESWKNERQMRSLKTK